MARDPLDIGSLPPWEPPKPATEAQLTAFERLIGSTLPADYRKYLRTVNGGPPDRASYHGPVMDIYVQYIYSLVRDKDKVSGLIYERRMFGDMPKTFERVLLPIAHANGGDSLCLSLVNGEIFFYNHEADAFTRIDDSFSSIMKNLK